MAAAGAVGVEEGALRIELSPVFNAGDTVLDFVTGPGGGIYLCALDGRVLRMEDGWAATLLDMRDATGVAFHEGDGHGLWGLAFHPGFEDPSSPGYRLCYTYADERKFEDDGVSLTGLPDNAHPEFYKPGSPTATVDNYIEAAFSHFNVVREWTMAEAVGGYTIDPTSSRVVLRVAHSNDPGHNGGGPRFGPDGFLYLAIGDGGGSGNDYRGNPFNPSDGHTDGTGNGQDLSSALGKVLRIDPIPSNEGGSLAPSGRYRNPQDNPFADGPGGQADEIFAYGFRNPWRLAFDDGPGGDGRLYLSDVGQHHREEIDVVVIGGNYGWPYMEGSVPLIEQDNYSGENLSSPVTTVRTPPGGYGAFESIAPLAEYKTRRQYAPDGAALVSANLTGVGTAVVSGPVYRGTGLPALVGKLLLGDYSTANDPPAGVAANTGRLFYLDPLEATPVIREFQLAPGSSVPSVLMGFGEDASGETYAFFGNGDVAKLVLRSRDAFASWLELHAVPLAQREPGDDPDLDGVGNLLEFVLLRDPTVADGEEAMTVTITEIGGERFPGVTFRRRTLLADIDLSLEIKDASLVFDAPLLPFVFDSNEASENASSLTLVRSTVPLSETPKQFLRLRASLTD